MDVLCEEETLTLPPQFKGAPTTREETGGKGRDNILVIQIDNPASFPRVFFACAFLMFETKTKSGTNSCNPRWNRRLLV
jgi:hypothetical protein